MYRTGKAKIKYRIKKSIAVFLCFTTIMQAQAFTAKADDPERYSTVPVKKEFSETTGGLPTVTTDESVYANLDYYGNLSDLNIVKGVGLNGKTDIVDYGDYSAVTNMTSNIEPVLTDGRVEFSGLDASKRFYYQCTPKDINSVEIPWKFAISYKLNGVPTEASKLAGASGLVEITIKVMPRDDVDDYLKNNILLTVGTTVDMTDNLSVDAPGAQLQAMGSTTVVAFAALPGQADEYVIRIGSESFENSGIYIAMAPGTADALSQISDINEYKDRLKDSVDAIYDSSNQLLDVLDSMRGGLTGLGNGLASLDQAREIVNSYGDTLEGQSDETVVGLEQLSQRIMEMIPHIDTSKRAITDITSDMDTVVKRTEDLKPALIDLSTGLNDVYDDLNRLSFLLAEQTSDTDEIQSVIDDLGVKTSQMNAQLDTIGQLVNGGSATEPVIATASSATGTAVYSLGSSMQNLLTAKSTLEIEQYTMAGLPATDITDYYDSLNSAVISANTLGQEIDTASPVMITQIQDYLDDVSDVTKDVTDHLGTAAAIGSDTSDDLGAVSYNLKDAATQSTDLINSVTSLNDTVDKYSVFAKDGLDSAKNMTLALDDSLNKATQLLNTINTLLKNSRPKLNEGLKDSLDSTTDLIDKTLTGMDVTDSIRSANDTAKQAWDDTINDLEDSNNFLNMNPNAQKASFTSDENAEPNSVQIIMRTPEISVDGSEATDISDQETEAENVGPWQRILNVLKAIWSAITGLFGSHS